MTEKTMKSLKMKNKPLKFKNPKVPKKAAESDSDISDSDLSKKPPKMDKKALKQISTEVTDLLASLKKEHGMGDDAKTKVKKDKTLETVSKKKEEKKVANLANGAGVDLKKVKKEKKAPAQNDMVGNKNSVKIEKGIKKEKNVAQIQDNSQVSSSNKKNKKRAAVDEEADDDEPQVKKVKENPKKAQKQKQKSQKTGKVKTEAKEEKDDKAEAEARDAAEAGAGTDIKKDYYLKDATPVFVGNLPVNIKRMKLVKLFKKFGKILSIRIRTNKGKSFYKKAQVDKVPHLIAFIYFNSREAAESSLECNGTKIGDNFITVDLDNKDEKIVKPQNTVVVGNLKFAVTDHTLREAFKCCGEIEHVRTVQTLQGCKGVAFVRFAEPESVALALKLSGTKILDREIRVERYKLKYSEKKAKKEKPTKPQKLGKLKKNVSGAKAGAKDGGKPKISAGLKIGEKKKKNKELMGAKSNDVKKAAKKNKKKNKMNNEKLLVKKVAPKSEKSSE